MPRYVILQHLLPAGSGRPSHYDVMLEQQGALLTWAVAELPRAGLQTTAIKLPDHRLAYLDYEGPISGDRGQVHRVRAGECCFCECTKELVIVELSASEGVLRAALRQIVRDRWSVQFKSVAGKDRSE